jgi:hypothetical protein
VARGAHVVTDALVEALASGAIGGAGLDVTDPEPLPEGHPLWTLPNCIVTPHVGNTPEMARPLLAERVRANVARWSRQDLVAGRKSMQLLRVVTRRLAPVCPDSPPFPLRLVHRWYSAGPGSARRATWASESRRGCSA